MQVALRVSLSDSHVDIRSAKSQRQILVAAKVLGHGRLPVNLCLVLDHSGSMAGTPLERLQQASLRLIDRLQSGDRLSIVAFNHFATALVPHQSIVDPAAIKQKVLDLRADGGTAIDEGLKLGIEELAKGNQGAVSQIFLLTDGENEHGDNHRCLKLASLAPEHNITMHTLGFGSNWNQKILEQVADAGGGSLRYIESPNQIDTEFARLFDLLQAVGITNTYVRLRPGPQFSLATHKPFAQVQPDTIELSHSSEAQSWIVRLGDLSTNQEKQVLINCYIAQLPVGTHTIATLQICSGQSPLTPEQPIVVQAQTPYQSNLDPLVQNAVLTLAKYRQAQMAELKLQQGDRQAAVTLLQNAAQTARQMGDFQGAMVLSGSASQLQAGQELSPIARKKTLIVSKTFIQ